MNPLNLLIPHFLINPQAYPVTTFRHLLGLRVESWMAVQHQTTVTCLTPKRQPENGKWKWFSGPSCFV